MLDMIRTRECDDAEMLFRTFAWKLGWMKLKLSNSPKKLA